MVRLLTIALALAAAPAAAQQRLVLGETPTQGVLIPPGILVGDFDATALVLNPAGLALTRGASLVYVHTHADRDGASGVGGDGFYLASAPVFGRVAAGLGFELLRPPYAYRPAATSQKLACGLAVKLAPGVSLGVTWNHLFAAAGTGLNGLDGVDVGVAWRAAAHVGFAYVGRDLNTPTVATAAGTESLRRAHEFEMSLRPLGDDR
ncbi:MAG TPA: hypothetical protein VGQ83_36905, partial [Polyangia bacterium]